MRIVGLILLTAGIAGTVTAAFLAALESVTLFRWSHPWLLYLLPLAGVAIVFAYKQWGRDSEAGNDLLIEDLGQDQELIPRRMAPFIFASTILTHLFGGSAGREGTAVQIGGSLGHSLAKGFRLAASQRSLLILCGMGAGFGAVFGTPVTGALFAIEVVGHVSKRYRPLLPVLLASVVGDKVCRLWTIKHTVYRIAALTPDISLASFNLFFLLKIIVAALAFGLCARAFADSIFFAKGLLKRKSPAWFAAPLLGGGLLIALCLALQTRAYLGLGVTNPETAAPSLVTAFTAGGVTPWAWLWKFIFTVVTLSTGFKGGEATPLFFIGAALGSALARLLGVPIDLLAGLGFVAVFAAATKTPIAGTMMGVELFGIEYAPYFALATFVACMVSGSRGVYHSAHA